MGQVVCQCCQKQQSSPKKVPRLQSVKLTPEMSTSPSQPVIFNYEQVDPRNSPYISPPSRSQSPAQQSSQDSDEEFYDIELIIEERQTKKLQPSRIKASDFDIVGVLGQGGFGSVYLVRLKEQGVEPQTLFAMKRIPRQKMSNSKAFECVKLQRKILENALNLFITSLKFAFIDRKWLYLVMEFASGGDVMRFISDKPLRQEFMKKEKERTKFIIACVILGLQCLHSQEVIYRDLKPQNVLLFSNGYAKLSDFGLAKKMPDIQQKAKTQAGTLIYSPPQMVLKLGYNKSVDFWTLGVFIYELATCDTPFKLEDISSKIRFKRISQEQQKRKEWRGHKLDSQLADLLSQLLRFDPNSRLGMKGWAQIKSHQYFGDFPWKELNQGTLPSPIKDLIDSSPASVRIFENLEEAELERYSDELSELTDWDFNYQLR